ncbi:hypothetical protein M0805_003121 [Coniferiporia weirii]|nr:hypothetical protein M0805_003121 [Coniferiporia weirii]
MQTVRLDDCGPPGGVDFAYIDSGAPLNSSDYTTVVCVHGHSYHAQTFARLLPLGAQHNLRILALNRRDYVGSTPYTPAELAALASDSAPVHAAFLRARALEVARFLVWAVSVLGIPRAGAGKDKDKDKDGGDGRRGGGGLALLGWSLGNVTTLAFLGHLAALPPDVRAALEPYLRWFFIYESTSGFIGYAPPPGAYHPVWDPDVPGPLKAAATDAWFTAYFSHPYFLSPLAPLDSNSNATVKLRTNAIREREKKGNRYEEERKRTKTLALTMDAFELRTPAPALRPGVPNPTSTDVDCLDLVPGMRSEYAFYGCVAETTLYTQFEAGLSFASAPLAPALNGYKRNGKDRRDGREELPLPELRVTLAYGTRTVWDVVWGAWAIEQDVARWRKEGRAVRPLDVVAIEGANHFAIWDDPALFMQTLAECVKS